MQLLLLAAPWHTMQWGWLLGRMCRLVRVLVAKHEKLQQPILDVADGVHLGIYDVQALSRMQSAVVPFLATSESAVCSAGAGRSCAQLRQARVMWPGVRITLETGLLLSLDLVAGKTMNGMRGAARSVGAVSAENSEGGSATAEHTAWNCSHSRLHLVTQFTSSALSSSP